MHLHGRDAPDQAPADAQMPGKEGLARLNGADAFEAVMTGFTTIENLRPRRKTWRHWAGAELLRRSE